jgi:hypothetical protein
VVQAKRASRPGGSRPGGSGPGGSGLGGASPSGGLPSARWFMARLAAALAAVLIVVTIAGFLLSRQAGGAAAWARSSGSDAVWVSSGAVPSGFGSVNVYAGSFTAAGRFVPGSAPVRHAVAWVTGTVGVGGLNLDSAATRSSIAAAARGLLRSGYSGLQLDLGSVASGDLGLLTLLTSLRALRPSVLGVMTPKLEPLAGLTLPGSLLLGHPVFWTAAYLSRVAAIATQVTVLAYSTGLPFPSWYSGYVSRETSTAVSAVAGSGASLLIGVPAFTESTTGHHGSAETVTAAIAGVRAGLTRAGRPRGPFGVGLVIPPPGVAGSVPAPSAANVSAYRSAWVSPAS